MRCLFHIAVLVTYLALCYTDNVLCYTDDSSFSATRVNSQNKITKDNINKAASKPVRNPLGYDREIGEIEMMVAKQKQSLTGGAKRNVYTKELVNSRPLKKTTDDEVENAEEDVEDSEDGTNAFNEEDDDELLNDDLQSADENQNDDVYANVENEEGRELNAMAYKEESPVEKKNLHSRGRNKERIRGNSVKDLNKVKVAEYCDDGDDSVDNLEYSNDGLTDGDKTNSLSEDINVDNDAKGSKESLTKDNFPNNDGMDTRNRIVDNISHDIRFKTSLTRDIIPRSVAKDSGNNYAEDALVDSVVTSSPTDLQKRGDYRPLSTQYYVSTW